MSKTNAEYMREYRARKKAERAFPARPNFTAQRIAELEEEVARLKRELAARPAPTTSVLRPVVSEPIGHAFNSRPFTPVPRKRV